MDVQKYQIWKREAWTRFLWCYLPITLCALAGAYTRYLYLEDHEDEFEDREDESRIKSFEFKETQIKEFWQYQWFWSGLLVFCGGLLVYGTENDESYIKDAVIRWLIAYCIYYASLWTYLGLAGDDLLDYRPSYHISRGIITQANYLCVFMYMRRREVQ